MPEDIISTNPEKELRKNLLLISLTMTKQE